MLLLLTLIALFCWVTCELDRYARDTDAFNFSSAWLFGVCLALLVCLSVSTPRYVVNDYPLASVDGYYVGNNGSINFIRDGVFVSEVRSVRICLADAKPFVRKYSAPWWWVLFSLRCESFDDVFVPSMQYVRPMPPHKFIYYRVGGNA